MAPRRPLPMGRAAFQSEPAGWRYQRARELVCSWADAAMTSDVAAVVIRPSRENLFLIFIIGLVQRCGSRSRNQFALKSGLSKTIFEAALVGVVNLTQTAAAALSLNHPWSAES